MDNPALKNHLQCVLYTVQEIAQKEKNLRLHAKNLTNLKGHFLESGVYKIGPALNKGFKTESQLKRCLSLVLFYQCWSEVINTAL